MAAQSQIGTGATAVLTTNALGMDLTNINWAGITRPAVKSSHIGTTDADTFIFAERTDWGTVNLAGYFNVVGQLPITNMEATTPDTMTVTFADGSTWAASVGSTEFEFDNPDEEMVTFAASFKVTGKPTLVPSV
jgi:hypothetical protein